MERASLPIPSKTAPTPFMTPCAVPQALSVRAQAIAKKLRLIITAPFVRSDLRNFEQFANNFWDTNKELLPVWMMERPVMGSERQVGESFGVIKMEDFIECRVEK